MRVWAIVGGIVGACLFLAGGLVAVALLLREGRTPSAATAPTARLAPRPTATADTRPKLPPLPVPAPKVEPPAPTPPPPTPVDPERSQTDTIGDVGVVVVDAKPFDDFLLVCVAVGTTADKVTFRGWAPTLGIGGKGVKLVDDRGNRYNFGRMGFLQEATFKQAAEEAAKRSKGGVGAGPVYADQPRAEFFAFERPVKAAQHLDLDLDAGAVGMAGQTFRLRIPRGMWEGKK